MPSWRGRWTSYPRTPRAPPQVSPPLSLGWGSARPSRKLLCGSGMPGKCAAVWPCEEPPNLPGTPQHLHLGAPTPQPRARGAGVRIAPVLSGQKDHRSSSRGGLNPQGQKALGNPISVPPKATFWLWGTCDKKCDDHGKICVGQNPPGYPNSLLARPWTLGNLLTRHVHYSLPRGLWDEMLPSECLGATLPRTDPRLPAGSPPGTSSTISPFSACTCARAPRSRMMLKISYIWEESARGAWGCVHPTGSLKHLLCPPLDTCPHLAVRALAPILVHHEDQEGVHTWRRGTRGLDTQLLSVRCLGASTAPRSPSTGAWS